MLRDKARQAKLEAEQHKDLFTRQRGARKARNYSDELGMVHVYLSLEPHVGAPIVARAEADAQRLARKARQAGADGTAASIEPFERYLADAYAALLAATARAAPAAPSWWSW